MKINYICRCLILVLLLHYTLPCSANSTILVLGDSLSAGYGMAADQGWVNLLALRLADKRPDYTVVNDSVSGESSAEGLQRLPPQLVTVNPQILIVALGSNDGLRLEPLLGMRINLSKIIDLAQSKSAQILLIGFKMPENYDPAYRADFENSFVTLSNTYGIKLVPFLLDGFPHDLNFYQADLLHPKVVAQPIMLDNVWKYLEPMFK